MHRQPFVLGFILRKFPKFEFSMDSFDDRLRLQKFIYLLQVHGVYLGYDFSWYLRGPYCSSLSTDGFMLADIHDDMMVKPRGDNTEFADPEVQKRFQKFSKFIKGHENDRKFLEVAASLHILLAKPSPVRDAVNKVVAKTPGVGVQYARDILDMMEQKGILPVPVDTSDMHSDPNSDAAGKDAPASTPEVAQLVDGAMGEPHAQRYVDRAIYNMINDIVESGDRAEVVQKRLFHPDEARPVADDFIMDEALLDKVMAKIRQSPQP